jgi:hypothetical protein
MSKARSTGNIGNIIKTSTTCVTVTDGTTDLLIMSGSGRVTIPGDLVVLGGIAGSSAESASYSLSSSFATNANLLDGIDGASFLQTGSFNTFSSSIDTTIKNKLNGDGVISGSVQVDITSTTGYSTFSSSLSSSIGSLSGSVATTTSGLSSSIGSLSSSVATTTSGLAGRIESVETKTGSYATTGSNVFVGNQVITGSICSNGNIVTTGQIVAQTINVQQVTSSIVYSCGSNIFGNTLSNTQQFTGSVLMTGSLTVNGSGIGVGTTSPTTATGYVFVTTDCVNGGGFTTKVNGAVASYFYGISTETRISEQRNLPIVFETCGIERIRISNTGIGIFSCQVCAPNFISDGGSNEGLIRIERDTVSTNTTIGSLIFTNNNAATTYGKVFGGRNSDGDGYVALGTGVSNNLYALESGYIGIGTSTPGLTLPTGGGTIVTNGWGFSATVCASRKVVEIDANDNNGGNVGLFLRQPNNSTGLDMWSDGYYGNTYIDSRFDNSASYLAFRFRTNCSNNIVNTMAITAAGNVSIGSCTPCSNFLLDIYQSQTSTTAYSRIRNNRSRNAALQLETNCGNYLVGVGIGADVNQFQIYDNTSGSNRFLISSTGNVGIGTTPSTWNTNSRALQLSSFISLSQQNSGALNLMSYAIESSANSFTYGDTGVYPTRLNMNPNDGIITFSNAGTGTAGNAITFTPRLTILANGDVGIGTATPYAKFEVLGGNQCPPSTGTQNYTMALRDPTSMVCGVGGSILFQGYKTGTSAIGNFAYIAGKKENGTAGNEAGYMSLGNFDSAGNVSERMRITSAGNVGIGITPTSWGSGATALQIGTAGSVWNRASDNLFVLSSNSYFNGTADIQITTGASNRIYFNAGQINFERAASTAAGASTPWVTSMVVTSSGSLLVGTTNADIGGSVPGTIIRSNGTMSSAINMSSPLNYQSPYAADRMNTAGDGLMYGMWRQGIFQAGIGATNTQSMTFITAADGSNVNQNIRMTITTNGSIGAPSGTNIYNPSDFRLKRNISTISNGLDKISALNPVKFNWIDGFESSEDGKEMLGFIAQEVYEVIPEAVESFSNSSITVNDIEIQNPLRVNEKFIIPVLVKAIQEQQSIICSQSSIIETLKSCLGIN